MADISYINHMRPGKKDRFRGGHKGSEYAQAALSCGSLMLICGSSFNRGSPLLDSALEATFDVWRNECLCGFFLSFGKTRSTNKKTN